MLKILEILEERNYSLEIREWKIPTFSNGGGWGLINDVLSNSPLFCGIGGPGKKSSYTGVVLSIGGTSLAGRKSPRVISKWVKYILTEDIVMIEVVAETVVEIEVVVAGMVDRKDDQVAKENNGKKLIDHN